MFCGNLFVQMISVFSMFFEAQTVLYYFAVLFGTVRAFESSTIRPCAFKTEAEFYAPNDQLFKQKRNAVYDIFI